MPTTATSAGARQIRGSAADASPWPERERRRCPSVCLGLQPRHNSNVVVTSFAYWSWPRRRRRPPAPDATPAAALARSATTTGWGWGGGAPTLPLGAGPLIGGACCTSVALGWWGGGGCAVGGGGGGGAALPSPPAARAGGHRRTRAPRPARGAVGRCPPCCVARGGLGARPLLGAWVPASLVKGLLPLWPVLPGGAPPASTRWSLTRLPFRSHPPLPPPFSRSRPARLPFRLPLSSDSCVPRRSRRPRSAPPAPFLCQGCA